MATRDGKALKFVSVPADYAGGVQEGDETPVLITNAGGGSAIVVVQDPLEPTAARNRLATGAAPNTLGESAVDLQGIRGEGTQVASGVSSVIGGGASNTGSGVASVVSGGTNNVASADRSTVTGGADNTASGTYSTAGGRQAKAIQDGTYAHADGQNRDFSTIIADEYAVRARGGVRLVTATDVAGVPTKTTTLTPAGLWTYTDADSRNDQLAELFASIPTADPLVAGRLWSNGGVVTISAG